MNIELHEGEQTPTLRFYGGMLGAFLPFLVFVSGVVIIALSGAPDERGFWPVLVLALGLGLLLVREKQTYCEEVIAGMSQQIVMIMITAWMLASIIGVLMTITGFVEALTWVSAQLHLGGTGFVAATFVICCLVSLSTGSSFATILICSPILYPAGGLLGADLPVLAGAIIGGAAFGDFTAPISDTTILSSMASASDHIDHVKTQLPYAMVAGVGAAILYLIVGFI